MTSWLDPVGSCYTLLPFLNSSSSIIISIINLLYYLLCREHAKHLALENDALQTQVEQTEKDTIDVVTYLKHQDEEKDKKVGRGVATIKQA